MKPAEPLALNHSWPLFERGLRFDLGRLDAPDPTLAGVHDAALAAQGIGRWSCDLACDRLSWSTGVYNLFDWRRDRPPERHGVLRLYQSESLSAVERLRAYAIRHRRGFTVDAHIQTPERSRWMRIIGAPQCQGARVIALHGLKMDVSAEYR
jgi:hypothetical protein